MFAFFLLLFSPLSMPSLTFNLSMLFSYYFSKSKILILVGGCKIAHTYITLFKIAHNPIIDKGMKKNNKINYNGGNSRTFQT